MMGELRGNNDLNLNKMLKRIGSVDFGSQSQSLINRRIENSWFSF